MRAYKSLLLSGIILFLAASAFLLSSGTSQATTNCVAYDCSTGDDTLNDFVQGNFYAAGLSNVGNGGVQLLPMGLTSQWGADPHTLPGNRAELAAVIYHDIIYAIGGWDETNVRRAEIFSATTTITGPLSASGWVTPATLPTALGGLAAAISTTQTGGYLYVVGGSYDNGSGGAVTSTISYRALNAGGAFTGSWQNNYTALPTPLVYANAVVRNGNLYVIGGKDNLGIPFTDNANVYRFPINSNGSLGAVIVETNTLASGRRSTSSVLWTDANGQDNLYVIGGQSGSDPPLKSVARTTFDLGNDVNTFTETNHDVLLNSLSAHAAVQSNGRVFIVGGNETAIQTPITKVYSALIDPTGSLHSWGTSAWIATTPLIHSRVFHAAVINSGGEVYVIGGYGDTGDEAYGTNTVYHGSTNGFGSQYAPAGSFTSRLIGLGSPENISEIDIGSTITGTATMTVQYRYGLSSDNLSSWIDLPTPLTPSANVTSTYPTQLIASVIQYRAFLTSTVSFDASPILNSFYVNYNTNLPDLRVAGMSALSTSGSPRVLTPTVIINNAGPGPLNRPILNSSLSKTMSSGRPSPRTMMTPSIFKFWVDFYIDRKPTDRMDLGDCYGSNQASIAPGGTAYVAIDHNGTTGQGGGCPIPAGAHKYYAQVDTCDDVSKCGNFGYDLESNENNNIGGPYSVWLFLPIINR